MPPHTIFSHMVADVLYLLLNPYTNRYCSSIPPTLHIQNLENVTALNENESSPLDR